MRFKYLILIFLLFSACSKNITPPSDNVYCNCRTWFTIYTGYFLKDFNNGWIAVYDDFFHRYELISSDFFYTEVQISSNLTGPVYDIVKLDDSHLAVQYQKVFGKITLQGNPNIELLPQNPQYVGIAPRDDNSVYGLRNDSIFIFNVDSLRESFFTLLPVETRHFIVSPGGKYVGTVDGVIFKVSDNSEVSDYSDLGNFFRFVDDSTLIFVDLNVGYYVKMVKVGSNEIQVINKDCPVPYIFDPYVVNNWLHFLGAMSGKIIQVDYNTVIEAYCRLKYACPLRLVN